MPRCTCCIIFQGFKQRMTKQWPAAHTCRNLSLITLRRRRYVKKQCVCIQVEQFRTPCGLSLTRSSIFFFIPDHLKSQEMCEMAFEKNPWELGFVSDRLKTQEMCNKAVTCSPDTLWDVPDHLKTQEICDKAVGIDPYMLGHASYWLVTQQPAKLWDDYCIDDGYIKWYDGYQKPKAKKAQIKKKLMLIAWHPSRWWDWCVPEDEKKEAQKLWG